MSLFLPCVAANPRNSLLLLRFAPSLTEKSTIFYMFRNSCDTALAVKSEPGQ